MSGGGGNAFFRPLWLRVAIVAACIGWAVIEYVNGETGWAMMAAGAAAYGAWSFLYAWNPPDEDRPKGGPTETE